MRMSQLSACMLVTNENLFSVKRDYLRDLKPDTHKCLDANMPYYVILLCILFYNRVKQRERETLKRIMLFVFASKMYRRYFALEFSHGKVNFKMPIYRPANRTLLSANFYMFVDFIMKTTLDRAENISYALHTIWFDLYSPTTLVHT